MIKNKVGAWGEVYAARYLRDNGFKIITANYVCRFGELDLVASKKGILSFIEVKTRNESTEIRPMEAVDDGKQERVRMAAKSFLSYTKMSGEMRFDVIEVYLDDNFKMTGINYIENAF